MIVIVHELVIQFEQLSTWKCTRLNDFLFLFETTTTVNRFRFVWQSKRNSFLDQLQKIVKVWKGNEQTLNNVACPITCLYVYQSILSPSFFFLFLWWCHMRHRQYRLLFFFKSLPVRSKYERTNLVELKILCPDVVDDD